MNEVKLTSSAQQQQISDKMTMEFNPDIEPLLKDNPRRFVIFPIQYDDIWKMYKKVRIFFNTYLNLNCKNITVN